MQTLDSIHSKEEYPVSKLLRRAQTAFRRFQLMFVSMPAFRFHVPEGLGHPDAFYARAMALSTHAAWFVLAVRLPEPEPVVETFLMAWDADVVGVLNSSPGKLESLLFVAPQRRGRTLRWVTKHVCEVWEATDLNDESECIVMVTEDGQEHSGYFMETPKRIKRGKLIAKVPAAAPKRRLDS
jgi:hypothetical protein